jgi:serine phosphatase RsbU (regulator of sigma subunit)
VTTLGRGDALVTYSDGVIEARSRHGEEFGVQRLTTALRGRTAEEIATGALDAVNVHSDGVRDDDLTLLVIGR